MAAPQTEDGAWRDLAERLLRHPYPGGPATRVEVVLDGLPAGWPANLPLPGDARLLGSVVHSFSDFRGGYMEAVLDANGAPPSLLASYQQQLGHHGWALFERPVHPRSGFVSGNSGDAEQQSFLQSDHGPLLMVTIVSRNDLPCDVRVRLDSADRRPSAQLRGHQSLAMERIPTLRAPSDILLAPSGGGGGSDQDWTAHATAVTRLAVGELETHFASQLSEAGWTRLGRGDDGVVAWSSWRLPGEQVWKGLLVVDAAFDEDQRSLMLRIEAQPGRAGSFFSTTSTSAL